jgi:hypothetical protein
MVGSTRLHVSIAKTYNCVKADTCILLEQLIRTTTAVGMEALKGTVRWVQSDAVDFVGMASIDDLCLCLSLFPGRCPGQLSLRPQDDSSGQQCVKHKARPPRLYSGYYSELVCLPQNPTESTDWAYTLPRHDTHTVANASSALTANLELKRTTSQDDQGREIT